MARENVMSTPIFDELLREMAQRAEPRAPTAPPPAPPPAQENAAAEAPRNGGSARRRHRAD